MSGTEFVWNIFFCSLVFMSVNCLISLFCSFVHWDCDQSWSLADCEITVPLSLLLYVFLHRLCCSTAMKCGIVLC